MGSFFCLRVMKKDTLIRIGYVNKTHGIKGELQAHFSIAPAEVTDIKTLFIELPNKQLVPYFVQSISINKQKAIVKLEDINSSEIAKELLNNDIYVDKSLIDDQEYYAIEEIIGYKVIDKNHGELGNIDDFFQMPGNDVIAMLYQNQEVLIPFAPTIVLKADRKNRILHVDLPDGLLELYLNPDQGIPDDLDETDLLD